MSRYPISLDMTPDIATAYCALVHIKTTGCGDDFPCSRRFLHAHAWRYASVSNGCQEGKLRNGVVPQNTLLSFTDVPKSQTLILLKSQKREVNGTLFAASVPMPKEADTQVCSQRMLGFFAHPPKKVYSRVRCLPQAIPLSSAPSTFDQPPETNIFRDTHNRCGGLGTVRFA